MEHKSRWQDGMNLVWGIWLLFSPFTLTFSSIHGAAWNAYVLGAAVIVFSVMALRHPQPWKEWANLAVASWLFLSPFVLGFAMDAEATVNALLLSLLIGMDSLWVMMQRPDQEAA